ncbi:MAG TPA: hypothetical protein VGM30_10135 [Puia sp.]
MAHQINDKEHEKFHREINALHLNNQQIVDRMGTDATRISHYRNGTKWPSKTTLRLFNREFRDDLEALEKENQQKEQTSSYTFGPDAFSPVYSAAQYYGIQESDAIALIDEHEAKILDSALRIKAIRTAMNTAAKKTEMGDKGV